MNILVTGCAGSTGSVTAERLLAQGHTVIGIDNLFNAHASTVDNLASHGNFTYVQGSILDKAVMQSLGEKHFDHVYHFAAVVETKHFYESPVLTYETNCHGTKLMLDFAQQNGVKSFLNASSSEVFGHQQSFPSQVTNQITFDSPLESTRWSYAAGKLIGEYLCLAYAEHMKVVSLRYANLYGPRDVHTNHIIPYTIRQLLQGKPVELTEGSDTRRRSFLHTDDCAEGTILALEKGKNGAIYALGGTEEYTMVQLVQKIGKLIGVEPEIVFQGERPGDPRRRLLDTSEIEGDTGWEQKIPLEEGLKQMIQLMNGDNDI
jgi:nucleoside-diphosphate-sugar epimerase